MCTHLAWWTAQESAYATLSLPQPKYVLRPGAGRAKKDLWVMQEACNGATQLNLFLDASGSPLLIPASNSISSSSSSQGEPAEPLELGKEAMRGPRNPASALARECCWKPDLWLLTESCPLLKELTPWAADTGNQQWSLFLGLCGLKQAPWGYCSAYTPPFTYSLKGILALLFLLCLHWNAGCL